MVFGAVTPLLFKFILFDLFGTLYVCYVKRISLIGLNLYLSSEIYILTFSWHKHLFGAFFLCFFLRLVANQLK